MAVTNNPSIEYLMYALIIVWWPGFTRIVRAQALSVRNLPYVEAARAAGAEVIGRAFSDFAEQRNHALAEVEAQWILFVDADEQITAELAAEIRQCAGREEFVAYAFPRRNRILGGWLRATGWYPDRQTRLLRRGSCRYAGDRPVHEVVEADGPVRECWRTK